MMDSFEIKGKVNTAICYARCSFGKGMHYWNHNDCY